METKYKDSNHFGAKIAMIALADFEQEKKPKIAELEANRKFVEGIDQRVLDFFEEQRAIPQSQKQVRLEPYQTKF
jgi:hypothetical protein